MIKLTCPGVKEHPVRPANCPHCLSKKISVHQTYQKSIKDSVLTQITIQRFSCCGCHQTFRVYPQGIKAYSGRSRRLIFLGVLLYSAGLSYAKVVLFLEAFTGRELEDRMTVWRDIQTLGEKLRRSHFMIFKKGEYVVSGIDGGYFRVSGKKVCIMFSVDSKDDATIYFDTKKEEKKEEIKEFIQTLSQACQLEAIVTDDWELYKEEIEIKDIPHQVCLAHMKKNFKKQIKKLPKEVPKYLTDTLIALVDNPTQYGLINLEALEDNEYLWSKLKGATQTRELFAALLRKWKTYTEYCHNGLIPKTNNHTERAIGRSKVRYKTTRGLKSKPGLLNFVAVTQVFGEKKFNLLKSYC